MAASQFTRRNFLTTSGVALAASSLGVADAGLARAEFAAQPPRLGKADSCIFIWLGGGMAQIDTFDPKQIGDPTAKKAGSAYPSIDTAVSGVKVCQFLPKLAQVMDRVTAVRTVNHNEIDEHAAATHRVHTGRPLAGTIQYPSVGSVVAHVRGAADSGVPAYVLIGYPNVSRGPGFLGPKAGYVYLTDTQAGPAGLSRPADVSASRQSARERLLSSLRHRVPAGSPLATYDQAISESLRLAGPKFMSVFDLSSESKSLRASYGGEFGQRCLLARRLTESGVRFIEVSHNLNFLNGTGWDTHNQGQLKQHLLIEELDTAMAALIRDLEQRNRLDRTLIVIGTEFGRPAEFDGGGGRGHQGSAFSMVLAGGGLRHQGAYGTTDELAKKIVDGPVSMADFHATIYATLGIDPTKVLTGGPRPVPITDDGKPIAKLFA
ncbi:DUF1501 domain-containing protein [Tuwongella immobilis]|uniref:DUF1501 domain-containing protein n=1 Tax=Tuwongella immobilis TaxID=692036 RepID=A0A6C2YPQ8_9BACT|nr:DUF1501 domain-containing protein [Tuwongella immobilis]VIP03384.1 secreted protein containing duf1501 : Uncharacterized protein OS=Singulisphaera acidiphila (strain ATCC BAA-1392 / DSM 18658 / VKM B-2454 / MOB10) GN=Sinac_0432 PE=4 SV=1: DUF1501 [Tuwongella immobilis]VTS04140.1 secreted protein containing duf1501 : Uncharacterized protein OS=Singulisphaera acidiphila (strain ATCC BAA-1392 / DSM 18658 / VKM B-2454 / MOB10) GN=Sinac_0432 PE=4 SV=1: DUF1501 [Tuwongella immobilis]